MNQVVCNVPPANISEVINRVLSSGTITDRDRDSFLTATFCGINLSSSEEAKIKEIFNRLQTGRLQVIN